LVQRLGRRYHHDHIARFYCEKLCSVKMFNRKDKKIAPENSEAINLYLFVGKGLFTATHHWVFLLIGRNPFHLFLLQYFPLYRNCVPVVVLVSRKFDRLAE